MRNPINDCHTENIQEYDSSNNCKCKKLVLIVINIRFILDCATALDRKIEICGSEDCLFKIEHITLSIRARRFELVLRTIGPSFIIAENLNGAQHITK